MPACLVCVSPDQDEIEARGALCLAGQLSWRQGALQSGFPHHQGLKNHMEKHVVSPEAAVAAEVDASVQETVDQLRRQMALVPAELKPLYATAIHNLKGLADTKPSQQHLLAAIKIIHEVTGMRMEQQLMLSFAEAHFGEKALSAPLPGVLDLPSEEV